ncbi:transcription factor A, mitochondrial [Oryzias latipes]|uniref:Transcription factor A, mitochondrial n=1 Tax=Oryzias latipes TaxID=8090 RepID=A0A3B3HTF5_ORYLA|nr:transcription factor A, mitochondrial [Oryzias latipes]
MAPLGSVPAAVSLLAVARSFSAFSCSNPFLRCLTAVKTGPGKCLTTQPGGPPKRPLNGYLRFVMEQKPAVVKQNPEIKPVDVIRRIAQQWRVMSPEQKKPFQDAMVQDMQKFKLDLQEYRSQLTPAQLQQQAAEKKQRMSKRKAIRKKRELTSLGKPKRPRSAFNIFMSEHFEEARGSTTQARMKSLLDDWRNLLSHQKQVYIQLAEDDKVRYKNEMKSWEDHMLEIGREDLLREQTLSSQRRPAARTAAAKKKTKTTKAKAAKKTTKAKAAKKMSAAPKSKAVGGAAKSSSAKTVRKGSAKKV